LSELPWQRVDLVLKTFRNAADEDYLVARVSGELVLGNQFAWSAAQAIEKYTKCILILNGRGEKGLNHSFLEALSNFVGAYPELFPETLAPNAALKVKDPFDYEEPFMNALERFAQNGKTDRRYRQGRLAITAYDLQKLDQIVLYLRRCCRQIAGMPNKNRVRQEIIGSTSLDFAQWHLVNGDLPYHERRLEAFTSENLISTDAKDKEIRSQFFGSFEADPLKMGVHTKRLSISDIEWAKQMYKISKEDIDWVTEKLAQNFTD
jgi:hypothetical protein